MKKKMLIAEDDKNAREALTKLAELNGYEVVAVTDGLGYLGAVSKEKFDLIITDLLMPDLNGVSATEIMKLNGDKTPIIAITALSHHDTRHIKERFEKIFYKPLNTDVLFEYIKTKL